MKLISSITLFIFFSVSFSFAQTLKNDENFLLGSSIPENIRPLLIQRLDEYIKSFKQDEPNQVFNFLTNSVDISATNKYTDEQKPCIATQITSNPLISFKPKEIIFSSANYGRPLNKKSWQINGEAEFENGSIKFTKDTIIAVKFVNQNWYFSLPNFYSKNWFDQKLSASDLTAELSHLLTVDKQPDCPIEISKVSVKINPEYNNLRKYTVEFTNKTEKTIKSFGYRIGKGLSVGGGTAIKPKESVQSIGNYGANLYFCENIERTKNIFVDFVRFSDGTEWRSKAKK